MYICYKEYYKVIKVRFLGQSSYFRIKLCGSKDINSRVCNKNFK